MADPSALPPLPAGFTLDSAPAPAASDSGTPPLPPGFTLDAPASAAPPATWSGAAARTAGDLAVGAAGVLKLLNSGAGAIGLPSLEDSTAPPAGTPPAPYAPQLSDFVHPDKWQQAAEYFAEKAGAPVPATATDRIVSRAVQAAPAALLTPEAIVPGAVSAMAGAAAAQGAAEVGGGPVAQTIAGLAGGSLAGGVVGAATRAGPGISPAAQRLMDEGVPVNLAQATGGKGVQQVDRASQMLTSGAANFAEKQQQAFNGAVLKRVGADPAATAATPDVLSDVRDRITGVMDDAAARGTNMDTPLATNLQAYRANLPAQIPDSAAAPIVKNLNDLQAAAQANGGVIPGAVLQRIRTNLGGLAKNPQVGEAAGDLQDIIDDAVQRSTPAADQAALTLARQQYRTLKQIEPAVNQDGDISPKSLMQSLQTKANRNQTLYGQGGDQSLVQLAKDARSVIPDKLGNSGTAERFLPLLSYLDALVTDHPLAAIAKTTGLLAAVPGTARLLRNQTVVQNAPRVIGGALAGAAKGGAPGSLGAQLGVAPPPAQ